MNHKALALLAALSFSFPPLASAHDVNPVLLSTIGPPAGTTTDIAVSGNLVYASEGDGGLAIFDASNPQSFQFLGSVDTPGFASGIALSGNLALVADSAFGLEIIDISNPSTPHVIGSYDTSGIATGVVAAGNLAYVADGSYGLQIIDFSTPSAPTRVGGYNTFGIALSVAVSGNYAYVADGDNGLVVIDVSIPASAHRVAGYDRLPATHITISGVYAYVSGSGPLIIFDISNPLDPQPISSTDAPGNIIASTVSGTTTYVVSGSGGFHVLDTTDPFAPKVLGSSSAITNATRVAASVGIAFVADLNNGIRLFAASNPAVMDVIGHLPVSGKIAALTISSNYIYVATGKTLQIIDAAEVESMQVIAMYKSFTNFPVSLSRIAIVNTYAVLYGDSLVNGSSGAIEIVSIADPRTPTKVYFSGSFDSTDIKAYGGYLVVASGDLGVYTVSNNGLNLVSHFSNISSSEYLLTRAIAVEGSNVWAFGERWVSINFMGKYIFKFEFPNLSPDTSAQVADLGINQIEVSGTNGFINGLAAFDPQTLSTVATTHPKSGPLQIAASTNTVYAAEGSTGVEVFQLAGTTLSSRGGAGLPDATAIAINGNHVFVGAGTNGLYALTPYQPVARLDASINTNRAPLLRLFSPIGTSGRVQRASTFTPNSFQDWQYIQLNSYPQILTDTNSRSAFYRFVSP